VAYPRRLLGQDEEIVLDLRPHWWYFSKQVLFGIPLLIILVLIWIWSGGTLEDISQWAWVVIALLWAGWLTIKFLNWRFTYFVLTTKRVIYRTGVLAKHGVEIPLHRINNINFHQKIWERVIGAGDLEIESAGESGLSNFENVQHPDAVQQEIYRQMEAYETRQAQQAAGMRFAPEPAPAPSGGNVPEQLQQLANLRDRGVITAAEFEAKKAQLLERM
jgi:uncharacterized membrane protein YdbT with pleckstrin-like domain